MPRSYELTIAQDIVNICSDAVGRDSAIKGTRVICRLLGGTMVYIPLKKKTGLLLTEIREVLGEAIGGHGADIMVDKIMAMLGGHDVYIPMEKSAFRDVISREIYQRCYYEGVAIREAGRDYGISFTAAYQLWKKGRKIKLSEENRT
jgi:Mor family transcriptional regulator